MSRELLYRTPLVTAAILVLATPPAVAQQVEDRATQREAGVEVYGFIMADAISDYSGINPTWGDAARPTQLPTYKDEFGGKGNFYLGVRQTRIGIKPHLPTPLGEITAQFDIDLFGTGPNAGQTALRLRHAYAQLRRIGFGQTESAFLDADVFPDVIDYWGPNGSVFFRNVQFRYLALRGDNELIFSIEKPGASPDAGVYADRVELEDVRLRFPLPDFAAHFRSSGHGWGHVQVGGILRYTKWDDIGNQPFDLAGDAWGWGVNVSTNLKLRDVALFRGQVVYGKGIQNYMNDGPVDIGVENDFSNPITPIKGVPLPMWGFSAFFDVYWAEHFTSSVGLSMLDIENSNGQAPDAFSHGDYASVNLLYRPLPNMFIGPELQYIHRANFSDGFDSGGLRVQLSGKYSYSINFGAR